MAGTNQDAVRSLGRVVALRIEGHGSEMLARHEEATRLTVAWLGYLRGAQRNGVADELLDGFQAALIEAAGCLVMGLVRPALFSMRAQVDIVLAWLYYKDHRVEWEHVEATGERYHLVSEVLKYLKTYSGRFQGRLELLRKQRSRGGAEPYRLLSAHVHSQNSATIPPLVGIEDLVQTEARCRECVTLQEEISEYVSDILVSCFVGQWADLPESIRVAVEARLGQAKLKELCGA